ncbi:MAG TPA: cyanophycin synthetase, partial [Myxococcota bacterium]|nr:cyanophycin synthetase [Myxococcota bacterium]
HGISCGLFTSPHLCTALERIRINSEQIREEEFIEAATHIFKQSASMLDPPSFFECMLAMAMWVFSKYKVKIAILEAGLGGRLDATTAVKRDIIGLSMIDFDHQNILGSNIESIALEKISAAHKEHRVVAAPQTSAVAKILEAQKALIGFKLINAKACTLPLGLYGEHQTFNAGLALACINELPLEIKPKTIAQGLMKVCWPGRFEFISHDPLILLDGAHNPSGIRSLVGAINAHPNTKDKSFLLVFGSMVSINTREKIALLNGLPIEKIYVHQPKNPRAESLNALASYFLEAGFPKHTIMHFSSWPEIVNEAKTDNKSVLVCGSLYTIGEARGAVLGIYTDPAQPIH